MASPFDHFDSQITFAVPSTLDLEAMDLSNVTVLLRGMDDLDFHQLTQQYSTEVEYSRFMGDVWVGIVLTLMIVTSIFCMCACFLYHKFRQWKASGELQSQCTQRDTVRISEGFSGGITWWDTIQTVLSSSGD